MTFRIVFRRLLPFVLAFSCLLTACGPAASPAPSQTAPTPADTPTPSQTATEPTLTPEPSPDPIAQQLAVITVEEKVGQLLIAGLEGDTAGEDARTAIVDYRVGGVIYYLRNVESAAQLTALTNQLKAMNDGGIPLFFTTDQEGGAVSRTPPEITLLPSALTFGQAGDGQLCYRLGRVLGSLCAAFGINMDFAPVLDVWSNPDNTVIGSRAYGKDGETVAACAPQVALGLTDAGVIPVGKHFPGHGDTAVDSHVGLPVVTKTLEELEQTELLPFRAAIDAETPIASIMVGHILLTELDPDLPASLSPTVVTGLLREELGFEGLICTDDLTMAAVADTYGVGEAAVRALEAGCDLLLVCHGSRPLALARDALLEAVASGRISAERLDESVERILSLKAAYGLTNDPIPDADVEALNQQVAELLAALDR